MRPLRARVRCRLARLARLAPVGALVLGSIVLGAPVGGCSLLLGFEDTTLRGAEDAGPADGGGPAEGGAPPTDGGPSRIGVEPTSLVIRRGASADLTVALVRGADLTGTVTARLSGLPMGVTAASPALAPKDATAVVHLTASSSATLGATTITLNADGSALSPVSIPLLVADNPGSLDMTFDANGVVSDPSRGVGSTFFALVVQPDGKILAAGGAAAMGAAPSGWIIRRYASNGVPDSAFNALSGAAGVAPIDGQAQAIAVDAKGNIVCVGFTQPAPGRQLTIVRLLPTGALDGTFGGTGTVRIAPEVVGSASFAFGVAVQPNGAIVVVGSRRDLVGTNEAGIVTRFLANGARDPSFNGGATVVVASTRFVGVASDADGFLIGGSTIGGSLPSYFATRRTAQGLVDAAFGSGGTAAFGNTYRANAFARRADGSIAVVGDVQSGTAGYTAGGATAKGGAVFARGYGNAAGAGFFGMALDSGGNIVAAGHTAVANGEARVERILPDGNRDMTFGTAGIATIEAAGTPNGIAVTLFAAAVQADGRILTAGNRATTGAVVYRLWQ